MLHCNRMDSMNSELFIYVDRESPKTPWIIRYPDLNSITGYNEVRVANLEIRTPVITRILDNPITHGKYALSTFGQLELNQTEPKAIIQASGMPKKW